MCEFSAIKKFSEGFKQFARKIAISLSTKNCRVKVWSFLYISRPKGTSLLRHNRSYEQFPAKTNFFLNFRIFRVYVPSGLKTRGAMFSRESAMIQSLGLIASRLREFFRSSYGWRAGHASERSIPHGVGLLKKYPFYGNGFVVLSRPGAEEETKQPRGFSRGPSSGHAGRVCTSFLPHGVYLLYFTCLFGASFYVVCTVIYSFNLLNCTNFGNSIFCKWLVPGTVRKARKFF